MSNGFRSALFLLLDSHLITTARNGSSCCQSFVTSLGQMKRAIRSVPGVQVGFNWVVENERQLAIHISFPKSPETCLVLQLCHVKGKVFQPRAWAILPSLHDIIYIYRLRGTTLSASAAWSRVCPIFPYTSKVSSQMPYLPSGKRLHSYGKSPFLLGIHPLTKSPFSIAMFVYHRVHIFPHSLGRHGPHGPHGLDGLPEA